MDEDGYFGERVAARYDESNLTTQDAQAACFRNAAAHLEPGGCFVIEVGVPELRKLPPGQNVVPFHVSPERWAFDIYDTATQAMSSNYVEVTGGRGEYRSIPFRYEAAGTCQPDGPPGGAADPPDRKSGRRPGV